MAADFGSQSSLASGTRTNSTLPAPSGISDGDVLLAFLTAGGSSAVAVTPPAGWTALTDSPISVTKSDPWTQRHYAWIKTASGESGDYTFTHSSAVTEGYMVRITGASGTLVDTPVDTNGTTSGSVETATGITTTEDDSFIVTAWNVWDSVGSISPPGGTTPTYTERYQGSGLYVATGPLPTAGATGNKSINTANAGGNPHLDWMVAVPPAGAGGTTENLGTTSSAFSSVTPSLTLSHALTATSATAALVTPTSTLSHALGVASCAASAVNVTDTRAIAVTPTSSAFSVPNVTTTLSQALLNTSTAGSGVTPNTTLSQPLSAASSTADGTETTETYTQSPDVVGIVSSTTTPITSLSHTIDPASSTFSAVAPETQRSIEITPTSIAAGTTSITTTLSHALSSDAIAVFTAINVVDSSGSFENLETTSSAFTVSSLTTTLSGGINAVSIVLSVVNPNVNLSHSITPPQGTFGTSTLGSSLSQEVGTATAVMSVPAIITTLEHSLSPTVATFTAVGTTEETSNSISLTPVSTTSGTSSFETRLAALIGIATATFTAGPISAIGVPIPIPPIDDIELDFDFVDEISIDFDFTENITLNFDFTDNIRLDF